MNSPWITNEILQANKEKDVLWARCKRFSNPKLRVLFRSMRNKVTALLRLVKRSYYNKSFYDNRFRPRKTWTTINRLLGQNPKSSIDAGVSKHFHSLGHSVHDFKHQFWNPPMRSQVPPTAALRSLNSKVSSAYLPS